MDVLETYAAVVSAAIHDVELFAVQKVARAEAELLRAQTESSERRYRFLAESIPQLVWTAQPDGAVDYYNQRWCEYTGERELEGWSWQELVHPDHRQDVSARVAAAIAAKSSYEAEYMLRRHDGAYRWHLVRAQPLLGEGGQVVKWFGTLTDIDDRKRAEQAQRLLTDATTALLSSLDVDRTLSMLAAALVPEWADGVVVDVIEKEELRRVVAVDDQRPAFARWGSRRKGRRSFACWPWSGRWSPPRSTIACSRRAPATRSTWRCCAASARARG
jgi:PAS domain S-box-containing protein